MNLVQRAQDILTKPKETWPQIAAEESSTTAIYQDWLIPMAAIPAVATFIGLSLIGVGGFGFGFRVPILSGLVSMLVQYGLMLAMVYVMSLIVNALAPKFGGTSNPLAALKLVAFGSTATFVAGVFNLLPSLAIIGVLAGFYSIYLLYLGLPVLMGCPQDKAGPYTAVIVVACIVVGIVVGAIVGAMRPGPFGGWSHAGRGGGDVTVELPGGKVTLDTAKMEAAAKKMEALGKQMEAAQAKGDGAAVGKAMGDMMGAMSGATGGGKPLEAATLKALLPESVGNLKRTSMEAQSGTAMGIASSNAKARYGDGDKSVSLSIIDLGSMSGMAMMAGWAHMTVDRETDTQIEKVYKQGDRTIREEYRKDGASAELTVVLPNGILVEAKGQGVNMDAVRAAVGAVDLNKLAGAQRPAN